MSNNMHTPLKNKNWLFPETGKEGFHYDDVSNAVIGLKKDLKEFRTCLPETNLIALIEKWFPDITEKEQVSWMNQPEANKKTVPMQKEEQLETAEYG